MITRCSQCSTKFEVSAQVVESIDPTVRCGECLSVFDARAQLVDEEFTESYREERSRRKARAGERSKREAVAQSTEVPETSGLPVAAEQLAHISDEDLEYAATVVVDRTLAEGDGNPADYQDFINDGFYSPEVGLDLPVSGSGATFARGTDKQPDFVGTLRHTTELDLEFQNNSKIDPVINLDESLDGTALEFERTMALEGCAPIDETVRLDGETHRPTVDEEHATGHHYGEQIERLTEDHDQASSQFEDDRRSTNNPVTSAQLTEGRDYPHIPDGVLADHPEAFDPVEDRFHPERHLSAEDLDGLKVTTDPITELEDQQTPGDHNSASELRRYVSSRGGEVVIGSEVEPLEQRHRSLLMPLLFAGALACAGLYLARDAIAKMSLPEPILSSFCAVTGCELPVAKDVNQLELIRHRMSSHKTLDDVLVFSVDLINRAKHPQPYPVLVVTMANREGESVAFRKFQPADYLETDALLDTLPAGKPVRIKFEIVDPGAEALSSELLFE